VLGEGQLLPVMSDEYGEDIHIEIQDVCFLLHKTSTLTF
jgi:hypothetical protein